MIEGGNLLTIQMLKPSGLDHTALLTVYTTCIRSVLNMMANYDTLELINTFLMMPNGPIYPDLSYRMTLEVTLLPRVYHRQDKLGT